MKTSSERAFSTSAYERERKRDRETFTEIETDKAVPGCCQWK